jgi:hypothetical protein
MPDGMLVSAPIQSIGSPLLWAVTVGGLFVLLAADFVITRRPHEVPMREAVGWSVFYLALPVAFGLLVWWRYGGTPSVEFLTGYVVEKSLSVDNLFVFMLLLAAFAVPAALAQRVLLYGIVGALVLRGIFDSVPAVFGVTEDPYLVFATNAFALLGLRALYFVLRNALAALRHLNHGLGIILAFIAAKLILHWAHGIWTWVPEVPTLLSLGVIIATLATVTVTSMRANRRDAATSAPPPGGQPPPSMATSDSGAATRSLRRG